LGAIRKRVDPKAKRRLNPTQPLGKTGKGSENKSFLG